MLYPIQSSVQAFADRLDGIDKAVLDAAGQVNSDVLHDYLHTFLDGYQFRM
jgi:hypothetical protein